MRTVLASLLAPALLAAAQPALAEVELSFYSGPQSAPHSDVTISGDSGVADRDFTAGWEGHSFTAPIHAGARLTWWRGGGDLGFGVEVNHAKIYADDETLEETGLDRLEFTDGLNIVTANVMRRFPDALDGRLARVTPYVGGGLGVAVPHVEVYEGDARTFEYQLAGPAGALMVGAQVALTERWSVFGEYKATYSVNEGDLDGGGTIETNVLTNALNVGVSYRF